jgi:hypothetical protein
MTRQRIELQQLLANIPSGTDTTGAKNDKAPAASFQELRVRHVRPVMASTSHHLFSFRRPDGAAPRLANARVTYLDYYRIFQFQRQLICTVEQRAGSSSTNRMFPANTGSCCLPA